jgi:hypothetical protein
MWLRARGRSKTLDAAGVWLSAALAGQFVTGDECYCAAASQDQAGLIVRKIAGLVHRSGLNGQVTVERHRVVVPSTGAALVVLSADVSSSWGLTPAWLTVDEFCMWSAAQSSREFFEALLTSLLKRSDSRCLLISTPSSPTHWSHDRYQHALADELWRVSHRRSPAPWQSAAELGSERRRLPEALYRRLFEAEWCQADDVLTSVEDVRACVRAEGALPAQPGVHYVTGVDLSTVNDFTVCATCHTERVNEAGGQRLVVDAIRVWKPTRRSPLDMAQVEEYLWRVWRTYAGELRADQHQAHLLIQRLQAAGVWARSVPMTVAGNNHRAQLLHRVLSERRTSLPADDAELVSELASLRLTETSPGIFTMDASESGNGHHDRATAISLAAERLFEHDMSWDWSDVYRATPPKRAGVMSGVNGREPAIPPNPWLNVYG